MWQTNCNANVLLCHSLEEFSALSLHLSSHSPLILSHFWRLELELHTANSTLSPLTRKWPSFVVFITSYQLVGNCSHERGQRLIVALTSPPSHSREREG